MGTRTLKKSSPYDYERWRSYQADYRRKNAAKRTAYSLAYVAAHKEQTAAYKRSIRHIENARKRTPEYRAWRNLYRKLKRQTDPAWDVADRLRKRIGRAIRDHAGSGAKKAKRTHELVGCSVQDLMRHIEARFLPGMTWDNRDAWHIDHRRPCAAFDLTREEDQKACFHYTNLQPLWAQDNIRKHASTKT